MNIYEKLWGIKDSVKNDIVSLGDKLQFVTPMIFIIYEAGWGDHNTARVFLVAFVVAMCITSLLKGLFNNPRPREVDGDKNPELDLDWSPREGNSFPSGHTMAAMTGGFFWFEISTMLGIAGVLLGVVAGASRIVAKAHWLRDVLTSTGISGIIYMICSLYFL